jgi:hypothetical protein
MPNWRAITILSATLLLASCGTEPQRIMAPEVATKSTSEPLSVEIIGGSTIRSDTYCDYEAIVTGGYAPYRISWDTGVGIGSIYTVYYSSDGDFPYGPKIIRVDVADASGNTVSTTKSIYVSSHAAGC